MKGSLGLLGRPTTLGGLVCGGGQAAELPAAPSTPSLGGRSSECRQPLPCEHACLREHRADIGRWTRAGVTPSFSAPEPPRTDGVPRVAGGSLDERQGLGMARSPMHTLLAATDHHRLGRRPGDRLEHLSCCHSPRRRESH